MAFIPKVWVRDEIIYEDALNRMETGIDGVTTDLESHTDLVNGVHGVAAGYILGSGEKGVPFGLATLDEFGAIEVTTDDAPQLKINNEDGMFASFHTFTELSGFSGLHILSNAYYNNGLWQRAVDNYAALALLMDPDDESFKFLFAPTGVGDIELSDWIAAFTFDKSGNFTITGALDAYNIATADGIIALGGITGLELTSQSNLNVFNQGKLKLFDSSTEYIGISAPSTVSGSYSLVLPAATGAEGKTLITDGAGQLSWGDAGGAGVAIGNVDGGRADSNYSPNGFVLYGGSAIE